MSLPVCLAHIDFLAVINNKLFHRDKSSDIYFFYHIVPDKKNIPANYQVT